MKASHIPAAVALAFALPAVAQTPPVLNEHRIVLNDHHTLLAEAASAKATGEAWRQWGDGLRASLGTMLGDHLTAAKVVKGAPYSAELSTEVTQALADGNVIAKKTAGRVYRDGDGRTRQETVLNGEVKSIQLRDPVEGSSVMLLPGSKTSVRMPHIAMHAGAKEVKVVRVGDREIRVENGKVSVDGKEVAGRVELKAGGKEVVVENGKVTIDGKELAAGAGERKVIVKRVGDSEAGDGTRREEVRVHVVRGGEGKEAHSFMRAMPPSSGMGAMGPLGPRLDGVPLPGKGTTTSLGVKEFEGIKAEGKSTVHTIAAGEIGNRNPIMVTPESWYSPELQVTVYSRQNDPRFGETVYRLTNIRRGEPAADLFRVPPEYAKRARS